MTIEREELEHNLRDDVPLEARVDYVKELLAGVPPLERAVENLTRDCDRLTTAQESMAQELRALRVKLGSLSPQERTAVEQRYEMLGKITKARGRLDEFERLAYRMVDEAVRELKAALAK